MFPKANHLKFAIANRTIARPSSSIRLRSSLRTSDPLDNRSIGIGTRQRSRKPDSYGEGSHTIGPEEALEVKSGDPTAITITYMKEALRLSLILVPAQCTNNHRHIMYKITRKVEKKCMGPLTPPEQPL